MKRLIKANHVSKEMREEVIKDVLDGERTMRINSSDSFLTAKELTMECEIGPTNEHMLKIMRFIDGAKYSDLGPYKENKEKWIERTRELFKDEKILIAKNTVAMHDWETRTQAIVFIDGMFFEDDNHNSALQQYFDNLNLQRNTDTHPDDRGYDRDLVDRELNDGDINNLPFACLHLITANSYHNLLDQYIMDNGLDEDDYDYEFFIEPEDSIFIEEATIRNIDIQQLVGLIKDNYPGYAIYMDSESLDPFKFEHYPRIAKNSNKKKVAYDVNAIVNKLYSTIPLVPSGNLIQNIMQDIQYGLYDDCGDPNENFDKWKNRCIELLKQRKLIGNYNKKYERTGKFSRLKKIAKYYNYIEDGDNILFIYQDPSGREVDNMLSESNHNVIRGFLHPDGTTYSWDGDYLHEFVVKNMPEIKSNVHIEISSNKLTVFLDGINNANELYSYLSKLNLSIYGLNLSSQLIIDYNYYGSYEDEIYNILNDNNNPTIGEFFKLTTTKVASFKKTSNEKVYLNDILSPENIEAYGLNTDYGNRDFAIAFIENKIYTGDTHKDLVDEYINSNDKELSEYIDHSEGYVTHEEQDNLDLAMGFASYIKGIDGNDYIAVYPDSTYIIGVNEFCQYLKEEFPNAIICLDNNDRYRYYDDTEMVYIEKI